MSITLKDLPSMVGRNLTIQVLDASLDDGYVECSGKLAKYEGGNLILLVNRRPRIISSIEIVDILPYQKASKGGTVLVRKLNTIAADMTKQHLLDRHGIGLVDIVTLSDQEAWQLHERIDHVLLAHKHRSGENSELEVPTLADISQAQIRQHLGDRHAMPLNIARGISTEYALMVHMSMHSTSQLGHNHTGFTVLPLVD